MFPGFRPPELDEVQKQEQAERREAYRQSILSTRKTLTAIVQHRVQRSTVHSTAHDVQRSTVHSTVHDDSPNAHGSIDEPDEATTPSQPIGQPSDGDGEEAAESAALERISMRDGDSSPGVLRPSLEWAEGDKFAGCVVVVTLLSIYSLSMETDFPDCSSWCWINLLYLLFYAIEFGLRCAYRGPVNLLSLEKTRMWASYDLLIVAVGILDIVVAFMAGDTGPANISSLQSPTRMTSLRSDSPVVRLLQLSRLLRVPRVFRAYSGLYKFAKMLIGLSKMLSWIFLVIFLFCFVLAIILTRLLGHGMMRSDSPATAEKVEAMFADIPTSMFTLFQLTTADDWTRIALPVIHMGHQPFIRILWQFFFIMFITFMSWTMLSLLTAVASEYLITSTQSRKDDEVERQDLERQEFMTFLCQEFLSADNDKNGILDRNEFTELMNNPSVRMHMRQYGICLEGRDVERTWETFDVDESGELDINELVDGFAMLQESLATKHVATIGYSLKKFSLQLQEDITAIDEKLDEAQAQQDEFIQQFQEQQRLAQNQWARFLEKQNQGAKQILEEAKEEEEADSLRREKSMAPSADRAKSVKTEKSFAQSSSVGNKSTPLTAAARASKAAVASSKII